jgi:hypothetical protein
LRIGYEESVLLKAALVAGFGILSTKWQKVVKSGKIYFTLAQLKNAGNARIHWGISLYG